MGGVVPHKVGHHVGCPLSGLLYATVMDPPLRAMADGLKGCAGGDAKACADDVGAALVELRALRALRRPFALAAGGIGLVLRPDKCRLVTLASWATAGVVHRIKRWLAENIPEWIRLEVTDRGTYLGF